MVFYSASKMMLLTEFFIKNRFFTLFLPRSFESCTYTHSPLGSFIPGIFDNVQQVPVRIAIVIRVVSSLPDVSPTPRSKMWSGSKVMATSHVHHSFLDHRQLSICT